MKLSYRRTIFVGFAFFLICAFWQAYDTIIPKILTDKFGMSQSYSGLIMGADNVLALFLLPLFGGLSDRTSSRWGRRTPFILFGTIAAAIALFGIAYADNLQLVAIDPIAGSVTGEDTAAAMETLYDAELTITTPSGKEIVITEHFEKEAFTAIEMLDENGKLTDDYAEYVVPARQKWAWEQTLRQPQSLYLFVGMLLFALLSMASFRSPAVALMPDVTLKPLRSKANSVINLMGAVGGIIVLLLGSVFATGAPENAIMSYLVFFAAIAGLMLVALGIFMLTVREKKLVRRMYDQQQKYGLTDGEEEDGSGSRKLTRGEKGSLLLILLSVALWYFGYNAVTTKYSVYAGSVLGLDYNMTLTIATGAAIVTYLPAGLVASKIGRRKTIMVGIVILGTAFGAASFMGPGSSKLVMNILFALAGVGWASINVNSFPMVVELAGGSNVGKYTGYYYTASMLAQTITPYVSGMLMDKLGMKILFPYGAVFVFLAIVTMLLVRHGDSRETAPVRENNM